MDAPTGTEQRVARPRPGPTSSRPPIQYRLPKPEDLGKAEEIQEEDYGPLVLAASHAALVLFVTQALSSILLANYVDALIEVRFIWNVIPYLAIAVSNEGDLLTIVSYSSAVSVAAVSIGAIHALIRHRSDLLCLRGWGMGLPMGGLLLAFQYLRHRLNPPLVDSWVLAQSAAALVAVTVVFIGFKPMAEMVGPSGTPPVTSKTPIDKTVVRRATTKQTNSPVSSTTQHSYSQTTRKLSK